MRIAIAAIGVTAIGLLAAGVLGVAGAETTPAPVPAAIPRTVGVQGVATAPIASEATAEAANAAYRQAMAAAVADGQGKAQFLAEKAGATLGPVQSVGEGGGYVQCPGEEEYTGVQPDFGSVSSGDVYAPRASLAAGAVTQRARKPPVKRHKAKGKNGKSPAKAAAAVTCTLSTQVALVYQLS
jgi:hypothetical protein